MPDAEQPAPFFWWSTKQAITHPLRQKGGSSSICSPLSYLCGAFLACLAPHQFIVSISPAQHKAQQVQNGMIAEVQRRAAAQRKTTAMLGMVCARYDVG